MARPILPASVLVNKKRYRIKLTARPPRHPNGYECDGICLYDQKEIRLHREQTGRALISTFLHELLHAIQHEYRIKGLQHHVIYALEGPLADFFSDNPRLGRTIQRWRSQPVKQTE